MTDQKDILDLLHRFVQTGGTNMLSAISLMKDAIDEIERLRVIVQGWEHSSRNAERDIETLRAERDEARRIRDELYRGEG